MLQSKRYLVRTVKGAEEGEEDEQSKLMPQTKRISKRDKAKLIAKTKQETAFLLSNAASKYIPPKFDDPVVDLKTKRRMIQLVKNRVAAQKTRDARKSRFVNIQQEKERVDEENRRLNEQNTSLLAKIRELEEAQKRLLTENEVLKRSNGTEINFLQSVLRKSPERQVQESFEDDNLFRELHSPLILSRRSSGVSRASRNSNICFTKFFALTIIIASFYSLRITKINPITPSEESLGELNTNKNKKLTSFGFNSDVENYFISDIDNALLLLKGSAISNELDDEDNGVIEEENTKSINLSISIDIGFKAHPSHKIDHTCSICGSDSIVAFNMDALVEITTDLTLSGYGYNKHDHSDVQELPDFFTVDRQPTRLTAVFGAEIYSEEEPQRESYNCTIRGKNHCNNDDYNIFVTLYDGGNKHNDSCDAI